MEERITCVLNSISRWKKLCSLLDKDNKWKELANEMNISVQQQETIRNASSPSRELLARWQNDKQATIGRLHNMVRRIGPKEAVILLERWNTKNSTLTKSEILDNGLSAEELWKQANIWYWKGCLKESLKLFKQAASLNHPGALLRLFHLQQNEEMRTRCLEFQEWFSQRASTDDPEAQYLMGLYFECIEKSLSIAVNWYKKAAEQNFAPAQYRLGWHNKTKGKDLSQAVNWLLKAADQGISLAPYTLGKLYESQKMYDKAMACYVQVATAGEQYIAMGHSNKDATNSYCRIAEMYANGYVEQDYQKAFSWFEKAAEAGNRQGKYWLGIYYLKGKGVKKDEQLALFWLRLSAENESRKAMHRLAKLYHRGMKGVLAPNSVQALFWLEKAAKAGNSKSQRKLGFWYKKGTGVKKDPMLAFHWFKKSAESGSTDGQYSLGTAYHNGDIISRNTEQAKFWLLQAAQRDHVKSMYRLANIYHSAAEQEYKLAFHWYQKAANRGLKKAMVDVAMCYHFGDGVSPDWNNVVYWLNTAAGLGYWRARLRLRDLEPLYKVQRNKKEEC